MALSFLQKLTGFGGMPTGRVVGSATLAAALHQLLGQLPELLLAVVVAADSGAVLAAFAASRSYQPAAVAEPAVAAWQQLEAAATAQGLPPTELQEVVLSLSTQLHVLRPVAGGRLLYLAADSRDTNLAIVRELAAEAATSLSRI